MTTIRTATDLNCQSRGKKISRNQAVTWRGKIFCLHSVLKLLARECEDAGQRVRGPAGAPTRRVV